ncbi:hypothetical protein N7481_013451 [Penicillium waksmanii]|uniref:uncharacterized protein n=1 Tax=Penicillium waksmanii TaxID=69791 RepID=UPI002548082C|nr:uncharacterized protein N7481_013451 [Penicillium waksmanii]KAJ5963146.1 hypothetical protein N7481_013451 [Penicillium waksmanii]
MTIHTVPGEDWFDIQDHLVVNLQKYSRDFSHNPPEALRFASSLPGLLRLVKSVGFSEAEERGHRIPACFEERVDRLSDVAGRLRANLKNGSIDDNEVAIILSMLYIQANKLAITVDARVQGQSTQFIGRQMARLYGSPTRVSHRESETYIAWDWLSNTALRCRCRTCLADESEA